MADYNFPKMKVVQMEIREILIEIAKSGKPPIFYSDLALKFSSIFIDGNDKRLWYLLGEISRVENDKKRGMLGGLVVSKEDGMPGTGFFDLAKELGRSVSDREKCWSNEMKRVYADWADEKIK